MNAKHFLIIGLAIAIIAISPLSAADDDMLSTLDITPFSEDTNVAVDGINFNVPKGFGEYSDLSKENTTIPFGDAEVTLNNYQYMNEDGDMINIQVMSTSDKNFTTEELPSQEGMAKKTLNGKDGMYSESDDIAMFVYTQDGKYVQVSADKDVISKVII